MKKERKEFYTIRRRVIRYNKILIFIFAMFMLYALLYSVSLLDCKGLDFYHISGQVSESSLTCTNMSTGFLAYVINHNNTICWCFGLLALIVLVLQKVALYRINRLETTELDEEKVYKLRHILITLFLGYTGLHKYRTRNNIIGNIYFVNFIVFCISWLVKVLFPTTFNNYLIFYCAYKFSLIFLIGILILNVVEAIFSFFSFRDDEDRIFA